VEEVDVWGDGSGWFDIGEEKNWKGKENRGIAINNPNGTREAKNRKTKRFYGHINKTVKKVYTVDY